MECVESVEWVNLRKNVIDNRCTVTTPSTTLQQHDAAKSTTVSALNVLVRAPVRAMISRLLVYA